MKDMSDKSSEGDQLERRLRIIDRTFDDKAFLRERYDASAVSSYYEGSFLAYSLLHSTEGSLHMAVSPDHSFKRTDYRYQLQCVDELLRQSSVETVLELGTGRGFNTVYLARRHPKIRFVGIDITERHLAVAQRKTADLENVDFRIMSFDKLNFNASSFGLVFEVESICHTLDMHSLLQSVHSLLTPGGLFVCFDGFRGDSEVLSAEEERAVVLVEKSLAADRFWRYSDWTRAARAVGFDVVEETDLSAEIMPNVRRFERMAKVFFSCRIVTKLLSHLLPFDVIRNSIAGFLMPLTIGTGLHQYREAVLRQSRLTVEVQRTDRAVGPINQDSN